MITESELIRMDPKTADRRDPNFLMKNATVGAAMIAPND
jgi:hypothetical protein